MKQAAIRDPNPVVFLENEILYGQTFDLTDEQQSSDFVLPLGKAHIQRPGTDVTITAYAKMVGFSLQAAEILQKDHGINAEVINLRSVRPFDRETVLGSIKKTSRIVSVEEGWPQNGIGAEIAAMIMESRNLS